MRRACSSCGPGKALRIGSCAICRICSRPATSLVLNDTKVIPSRLHGVRVRDETCRAGSRSCCTSARARIAGAPLRGRQEARGRRPHPVRRSGREHGLRIGSARCRGRWRRARAARLFCASPLPGRLSTKRSRAWANCRCRPISPASGPPTNGTFSTTRRSMRRRRARSRRRRPACISPTSFSRVSTNAASAANIVTLHVGAGTFLPVKADDHPRPPHACRMGLRVGARRPRP